MNNRVALVSDRIYPFYMGGYEYLLYKIAKSLNQSLNQFYDITVFTSLKEHTLKTQVEGIKFVRFSRFTKFTNQKDQHSIGGILKFYISIFRNNKMLKDFDLVIINSIPYFGIPYLIKKLNKKTKVAVIFHEAWYNYPDKGFLNYIQRLVIRKLIAMIVKNSHYLFSVSQATTNSLIENYGAVNVFTVPEGIDTELIQTSEPFNQNFDLVYLGRLASIKHIDNIILATKNLKERGVNLNVAIIGDGPQKYFLKNLTLVNGLSKNIKFFGKVKDSEKYSIMKSSRIFIMPSEREGFSIATLESMACGCVPIVAIPKYPELFGICHYLKNGFNGLLYNLGNISELTNKINELLSNESYYNQLRSNAIRTSINYSWENSLSIIENYIRLILK